MSVTHRKVALLTAGRDKPYGIGLATALLSGGVGMDFIASDEFAVPALLNSTCVNFLNLRKDQSHATLLKRVTRVLCYYGRLVRYAWTAEPEIFHILWNNKFEFFDRTLLMLYYKALGKRIVLTAHNVNAGTRDANDSWFNRVSLRVQYRLCEHVFVHTEKMKQELVNGFSVSCCKVTVIPFGINNTVPVTALTRFEAKRRLGLTSDEKAMLFFGNIAPYKGLEYLIAAFNELAKSDPGYRLIIVGRPKGTSTYWAQLEKALQDSPDRSRIIQRIEYIPDEETELYFKAADVLVLPYTHIFQSGVLFLGYSFGLPVIATDVGSLKEEIVEEDTGFTCRASDSEDLARTIQRFFKTPLYYDLESRRQSIREFANKRYSWTKVARLTTAVYSQLAD